MRASLSTIARTAQDPVRFLERFDAADVEPQPGHLPRADLEAVVHPLDEPAGLVEVVSLDDVFLDHRQSVLPVVVERDG